jgi:hypothetical protein
MLKLSEICPRVYLAGSISKNCWRHTLVPGLRGALTDTHTLPKPIDCGLFTYTGPFFVACDHGCSHGPATHGVAGYNGCGSVEALTRGEVFRRNCAAIESADIVIAYITRYDCVGTVWEIAYAQDRGIPTYLVFAAGIDAKEFWVPGVRAAQLRPGLTTATVEELPAVVSAIIRLAGRRGGR